MIPLSDNLVTRRFPFVTVLLIASNLWMFAFWEMERGIQASAWSAGVIPLFLAMPPTADAYLRLVTYMFLHAGWLHLLGNMWFLWIFGRRVEEATGGIVFAVFYLACGILAGYVHAGFTNPSLTPLVGASGAVSGVLGAYLVLYPRARIMTLVPIIIFARIVAAPAALFLLLWMGLQVVSQAWTPAGQPAGVAYFAHIGGFVSGAVLILFVRGPGRRPAYAAPRPAARAFI